MNALLTLNATTQLKDIAYLPEETLSIILEGLIAIDEAYGADMKAMGYGGIVVVLEDKDDLPDFSNLLAAYHLDLKTMLPEFVHLVTCSNGQLYCHSLILNGSDFGVIVLSPLEITPGSLMGHLHH